MSIVLDTLAAASAIASIAVSAILWLRHDQHRWALLLGIPSLAALAVPFAYFVMIVGSTLLSIASASASPMGWWASTGGHVLQALLRGLQWLPILILPTAVTILVRVRRKAPVPDSAIS